MGEEAIIYDMGFNHYAKLKRIIAGLPEGWYIQRIDSPTTAKNFKGESVHFPHYYRIYTRDGEAVPYGKFQQLELLARALHVPAEALPVIE